VPAGAAAKRLDQPDQARGALIGAQHPAAEHQGAGRDAAQRQDGGPRGACRGGKRQAEHGTQAYGDRDAGAHDWLTS